MIPKGASEIKGIRSLNTRPGPVTESGGLLKLYQLAAEKENLLKKVEWIKGQRDQTEKRLAEIAHTMRTVKKTVEERAKRELASNSNAQFRIPLIKY